MEVVTKVIEYSRPDVFTLWPLGDIHAGVVHCDEDLLAETVKEIKDDKRNIWLGMGDYGDCVTPSDFKRWDGRILADWMKGQEDNIGATQMRRVDSLLGSIWTQCLGLLEGNHDDAIRKYNHYNFIKELLLEANKKSEVPYAGVSCFLRLIFRRKRSRDSHEIIIHARHGDGSARTPGARALAVLRLALSMTNAHIILMGHLHGQDSPDLPQRLVCKNGRIKSFDTIATMTGAWLKAYMQGVPPTYLERWGCPPSTLGCPRIEFEPNTGRMELRKARIAR